MRSTGGGQEKKVDKRRMKKIKMKKRIYIEGDRRESEGEAKIRLYTRHRHNGRPWAPWWVSRTPQTLSGEIYEVRARTQDPNALLEISHLDLRCPHDKALLSPPHKYESKRARKRVRPFLEGLQAAGGPQVYNKLNWLQSANSCSGHSHEC